MKNKTQFILLEETNKTRCRCLNLSFFIVKALTNDLPLSTHFKNQICYSFSFSHLLKQCLGVPLCSPAGGVFYLQSEYTHSLLTRSGLVSKLVLNNAGAHGPHTEPTQRRAVDPEISVLQLNLNCVPFICAVTIAQSEQACSSAVSPQSTAARSCKSLCIGKVGHVSDMANGDIKI